MAEPVIANMELALQARQFPTITMWNRVEGRPRTDNFDRTLRAEVRDPLWTLAKQWQLGEFRGDDAGSPAGATIHLGISRLDGFRAASHPAGPLPGDTPLEAQVEQQPIVFQRGEQEIALDIRLLMGRHWLKLLAPIGDFSGDFIARYPVERPDLDSAPAAEISAHRDAWQHVAAVAGRSMDGYKLYRYLIASVDHHAHDGTSIPAADHDATDTVAARYVAWFRNLFTQPTEGQRAWRPEALEYQFTVSATAAGSSAVLTAEDYHQGRLDWYNLDVEPVQPGPDRTADPAPSSALPPLTQSFLPAPLTFHGMPNSRWWEFEDADTNFGDANPSTTDLAKLMLIEFGLVYANDWFIFPLPLPTGTITRVRGLAVTNVFGERIWIEAAGQGGDEDWQRWSMYTMAVRGTSDGTADSGFVLLPTVPKVQQGQPQEEVLLIRDEMANMVWGIETRVALPDGRSKAGLEAAIDRRAFHERLVAGDPGGSAPGPAAQVRYQVMSNNVPENWIPFIPVHVPGDNREVQLQRAALPRIIPHDPAPVGKIRPLTALLREGLDIGRPYFVQEEKVPRAGTHLTQAYQRTRWHNGRVIVWLGTGKQTGRGEGFSKMAFDQLVTAALDRP